MGNAPQQIPSPHFPVFDKDSPLISALKTYLTAHLSTLMPTTTSCTCFPNTNTNSSFYYYNHLRTIYTPRIEDHSQTLYSGLSLSITQTVPFSSHPHPRPSTTTNYLPLSSLFGSRRWNKYFHIPAHVLYSENTFQFEKCIQRQVGKVTFPKHPDRSHLVIVDLESQAQSMLKDLDGKLFPVFPDTQLNTRTGTVLISHEICPVGDS